MKEYMVHIWGGEWNKDVNPSIEKDLGIKEGYHYFKTDDERKIFISKLQPYSNQGMVIDKKDGEMTHKRTIAKVKMKYKNKTYDIEYDFDYEYDEETAEFMFFDGNYSCDCNKSLFIQRQCDENFTELGCGDDIEIIDFEIVYKD